MTAIHSASASHLAKRQGKEDTLRLLENESRALLQKIDMDGKMKKMAELQMSVISDQKNRKAIESQVRPKRMCLWMLTCFERLKDILSHSDQCFTKLGN